MKTLSSVWGLLDILVQRFTLRGRVIGSLSKRDDAHPTSTIMIGRTALHIIRRKTQSDRPATTRRGTSSAGHLWASSKNSTLAADWLRKHFEATPIGSLISRAERLSNLSVEVVWTTTAFFNGLASSNSALETFRVSLSLLWLLRPTALFGLLPATATSTVLSASPSRLFICTRLFRGT
jgi:hypothetical protein